MIQTTRTPGPDPHADPVRLLHDLKAQELELEIQNRQLREAQRRLERSEARAQSRLQLLAMLGERLTAAQSPMAILTAAADASVDVLGDACVIWMRDRVTGEIHVATRHPEAAQGKRLAADVREGRVLLNPWLPTEPERARWVGDRALALWLSAPVRRTLALLAASLTDGGEPLGGFLFGAWKGGELGEDDRLLVEDIAQRVSQALANVRLQQKALRQAQLREGFLAVLSHDLVNACMGVKLSGESVRRDLDTLPAEPRSRTSAEQIVRAADSILDLVQRLQDTEELESGGAALQPRVEGVAALMAQAEERVRPLADRRAIHIERQCEQGLEVEADPARIARVLANLLENAVKFNREGGRIWLLATPQEATVLFCVRDEGPGFPRETRARLFDRSGQARAARRASEGLGLPIACAIVEAHGGQIWAETPPGEGARVFFTLPKAFHSRGKP